MDKSRKGFTLIEILVVIGIIAILAAIVIIAINPARQFSQARDAQRWSNVNTILNGVWQYAVDNQGSLPSTITSTDTEICKTGGTCGTLVDLSVLTSSGLYLVSMPIDPSCPTGCDAEGTGYKIASTSGNRIVVKAPNAELTTPIEASR